MTKKELDLFQLTSRGLTQTSASPAKIMGGQFRHTDPSCAVLHNVPDRFFRHAVSQSPPHLCNPAKDSSPVNSRSPQPPVQLPLYPVGDWNRSDVPRLANQVNNSPVVFSLLQVIYPEADSLMPSQPTCQQQSKKRSVPFPFEALAIRCLPKRVSLVCCQPVSRRTPSFFTPLTRRIPPARSELSSPQSAAS